MSSPDRKSDLPLHSREMRLKALGFADSAIKSAVQRCNSTPAAARYIMDGGVEGWERKTSAAVLSCEICMRDDLFIRKWLL